MRNSKYWDDFALRLNETVGAVQNNTTPPVRRVAVFITDRCNFRCKYCNVEFNTTSMPMYVFDEIIEKYGKTAIIHITGGEPSVVPWLYPYLEKYGDNFRFHLNTNAYITPPAESVKRLKISLDSNDAEYWNNLVGRKYAFEKVVDNIKYSIPKTVVSLIYTVTKQNFRNTVNFAKFCEKEFPGLYAIFFSVYKGRNENFLLSNGEIDEFFDDIIPELLPCLNEESQHLLNETIDEKRRLIQGVRFEQKNTNGICYLSMSERVFSPNGNEYTCSHLYRDKIFMNKPIKHDKCKYGCNQRLVCFNNEVERILGV